MPKPLKKRKTGASEDVEIEILAPKNVFKPFDAKAKAEEEHLSSILFGYDSNLLKSLEEAEKETDDAQPSTSTEICNVDSGIGEEEDSDNLEEQERKPAWIDEDDEILVGQALAAQGRKLPRGGINSRANKYSYLLKQKFITLVGDPNWASLKRKKEDSDSDEDITQTCGFLKEVAPQFLQPNTLEFKRVKDLNAETYAEGIINCTEFHPTSSVALIAGNSGVATLYSVDSKESKKLHSVSFQQFPVMQAKFFNNGNEAILGSRHPFIYNYDLISAKVLRVPLPHGVTQCKSFVVSPNEKLLAVMGKWGEVHVLSTKSKEKLFTLKQNSEVTSLSFNSKGNLLFGHSEMGEVTVWDMNMQRVKHKWIDDGCIQGSMLKISPNNQYIAAGSRQGVVNVYDMDQVLDQIVPRPRKSVLNLTTGINDLSFNSTSEMLVLSSQNVENAVRILHIESGTVFSNFPSFGLKLGYITAVSTSPGSGYLAIGNKKATVSLFRLKHYNSY